MLKTPLPSRAQPRGPQRGLVLVLALIVLAALSLAAVGLMRGVLGSNRVAGNLAYQQAAVQAADVGVERAAAWLEQLSYETLASGAYAYRLYGPLRTATGSTYNYSATRADPGTSQTWESFWATLTAAGLVNTLGVDANGNTVSFVIHRLCANTGAPKSANCEARPRSNAQGGGMHNPPPPQTSSQTYYRVTVRVQGPRNASSFIQAVVAI